MKDCENIKFCSTHGIELDDNMVCVKCKKNAEEDYKRWEREPKDPSSLGKKTNYLIDRLNNYGIKETEHWSDNLIGRYPGDTYKRRFDMCHNCQYFMWHSLNWCAKCGQRFSQENLTYTELAEKYKHYRQGY